MQNSMRWFVVMLVGGAFLMGSVFLMRLKNKEAVNTKPLIVTTFHPITALTLPIVGDVAQLEQLIPSGSEVHDYQATPENLIAIQNAHLVIENGANLEHAWLDPLLEASKQDMPILDLAQAIANRVSLLENASEDEVGIDPHFWMSPKNAIAMTEAICDALVQADPAHAPVYQTNSETQLTLLRALDLEYETTLRDLPRHEFIAFHDAYSYLAHDYGLKQVATFQLTPGEAPRPSQLVNIETLVRTYNIRALFVEPQSSPAIVEQIAKDLDVAVRELDPLEVAQENESYIQGMQRNLATLVDVLGK